MLANKIRWVKYTFLIFAFLTAFVFTMLMSPFRSFYCYNNLTNNVEFVSLMDEYVFLTLNYRNTTLAYPTKVDLKKYFPNVDVLEKDINQFGVTVQHVFTDSTFELKVVCNDLQKSCVSFETKRRSYWSFLLNKSIVWQSFDNQSNIPCIFNNWLTLIKSGRPIDDLNMRKRIAEVFKELFNTKLNYMAYCHYSFLDEDIEVLCDEGLPPENFATIKHELKHRLDVELAGLGIDELYFRIK